MAACTAWFHVFGCAETVAAAIRGELTAAGIDAPSPSTTPRAMVDLRHSLLLLKSATNCSNSLTVVRSGSYRILAVAVSIAQSALPVWQLLQAGASDALIWDNHGVAVRQISAKLARWSKIDDLVDAASAQGFFVGESPAWRALVRKVVEAAHFSTAPILLTGESGTGKELLARLISTVTRAGDDGRELRRELVTVDCRTLLSELSGSEFFGHERGAFTGAHAARDGTFALADGATLLLDEIGDIPLALQPQILRSIRRKTYKRLGGNVWQRTDFRLVAATNRDLQEMVQRGQFRIDLYYRIAGRV